MNDATNCPWKEYKTQEGKVYYYNTITKTSSWTIPEDFKHLFEKKTNQSPQQPQPKPEAATAGAKVATTVAPGGTTAATAAKPLVPSTKAEAKEIFCELMISKGVDTDSTWESAMEKIIDDPRYKVLSTLAERKQTFFEFIESRKTAEEEAKKQNLQFVRDNFRNLLDSHKESLNSRSNFKKFEKLVEADPRWTYISSEYEREFLFEEYLFEIEKRERVRILFIPFPSPPFPPSPFSFPFSSSPLPLPLFLLLLLLPFFMMIGQFSPISSPFALLRQNSFLLLAFSPSVLHAFSPYSSFCFYYSSMISVSPFPSPSFFHCRLVQSQIYFCFPHNSLTTSFPLITLYFPSLPTPTQIKLVFRIFFLTEI